MSAHTVLITGAGEGLGSALARHLMAQESSVVLFRRSAEPLERLAGELGDRALVVAGDAGSRFS